MSLRVTNQSPVTGVQQRAWPGSPPFAPAPATMAGQQPPVRAVSPPPGLPGPIFPGPGWAQSPGNVAPIYSKPVTYSGPYGQYGGMWDQSAPFFKFGMANSSLLILSTLAGAGLDKFFARTLHTPEGWGPVVGVSAANLVRTTVSAYSSGATSAASAFAGSLLPVVPVLLASSVLKKSPKDKAWMNGLMALSALFAAGSIFYRK